MKEITKETFLRAYNSPLSTAQTVQFGNSLFGDFTTLVQVNNLYFLSEIRAYYKAFGTEIEEGFFKFDSAAEALAYFAEAETYADNYASNNGTCAGGF
jgi:hypothetical protein